MQYTISALVANKSGVLMRVSSLFSRRAYNIDSLSVCATEDPEAKNAIFRELLLIKVNAPAEKRAEIYQICQIFRAKVDDLYPTSMVIELTGESNKLDGFINMVKDYGILEMARTGVTAISRGDSCIKDMLDYNERI